MVYFHISQQKAQFHRELNKNVSMESITHNKPVNYYVYQETFKEITRRIRRTLIKEGL